MSWDHSLEPVFWQTEGWQTNPVHWCSGCRVLPSYRAYCRDHQLLQYANGEQCIELYSYTMLHVHVYLCRAFINIQLSLCSILSKSWTEGTSPNRTCPKMLWLWHHCSHCFIHLWLCRCSFCYSPSPDMCCVYLTREMICMAHDHTHTILSLNSCPWSLDCGSAMDLALCVALVWLQTMLHM